MVELLLRAMALRGTDDEIALVFYNTKHSKSLQKVEHVWVEQYLGCPSVDRIKQLAEFSLENFGAEVGMGDASRKLQSLHNALWQANTMISRTHGRYGQVANALSVMVCTCDASPAKEFDENLQFVK